MRKTLTIVAAAGLLAPVAASAQSAPGTSITTSTTPPAKSAKTTAKMHRKHAMKKRQASAMMPAKKDSVGTSITTKPKSN